MEKALGRTLASSRLELLRREIQSHPARWANEFYGLTLWDKQEEIIKSVFNHRRTAVKGCVASSKSLTAGLIVHAFLQSMFPAKVFSTAPTSRQVEGVLWGEVRSIHAKAKYSIGGDLKPVAAEWRFGPNHYALGFSTNDPNRFHGWHGENVLFILDEVQGIDEPTIQAIENVMADGNARLLILENPSVLSGLAYNAFTSHRDIWNCITIAAKDTPNYKERRVVIPGMITYDQCEEWEKTYGEDSDFFRVKVLAEFPKQEADTIVPLNYVEAAWDRERDTRGIVELGVDVARFGDDDSVIQAILGNYCPRPTVVHGQDTMQVAGLAAFAIRENKATGANIDVIGLGAGVYDRLREQGLPARPINVSEKPRDEDKFHDTRSELWWGIRLALDPTNPDAIALDRDDVLAAELIGVKYSITSAGKIKVEQKDETKKRIGRSPDRADALCLALANRMRGRKPAAAMSVGSVFTRPTPEWMG